MAKTWLPDPSHYPEQMTPLSATVWFASMGMGLHEAMRELEGPFGGFETRTELGWAYEGELEPDWEHEPAVLREAALTLAERWERELKPRVEALTREQEAMRPEEPPPAEAAALLDRLPNESTTADRELARLAERARELGVERLLREHAPADALARLHELQDGRRFLHELDAYLLRYGGRARWHELSLPREAESPQLTLESIRLLLEAPRPPTSHVATERERLEAETLARAPELREVLEPVKTAAPLKETHTYFIDYPALLATREALLGFGRRLAAEGALDAPDDVWMLTLEELRAAIVDPRSLNDVVALRRDELARGRREGPQPYLGSPPVEQERHAVLEKFYGPGGGAALRGVGASPGVGEGTARVVSGPGDFSRVEPGDVLVTTTTTPAWTPLFPSLAGLVTATGGILSHAAVVAREYRLPAVVGVPDALDSIPDGARVRVDGSTGSVAVVG